MHKILICLVAVLNSFPAMADNHGAEVRNAVKAFNSAYANNKVKDYFTYYDDDAMLYWDGARQILSTYRKEWTALVKSGGAVERNELSDLHVKAMPGGDVVLASYFIDYRLRTPDGEVYESKNFESDVWQKIDGAWKVVSLNYTEIAPQE